MLRLWTLVMLTGQAAEHSAPSGIGVRRIRISSNLGALRLQPPPPNSPHCPSGHPPIRDWQPTASEVRNRQAVARYRRFMFSSFHALGQTDVSTAHAVLGRPVHEMRSATKPEQLRGVVASAPQLFSHSPRTSLAPAFYAHDHPAHLARLLRNRCGRPLSGAGIGPMIWTSDVRDCRSHPARPAGRECQPGAPGHPSTTTEGAMRRDPD